LMVNCFAAASMDLISPIACLAAMFGSVCASEAELDASKLNAIAAAKKNVLITSPFLSCLVNTTKRGFMTPKSRKLVCHRGHKSHKK